MGAAYNPAFDSAWYKWAWAIIHAERFRQEQIRLANGSYGKPGVTTLTKYDPKRRGFVVEVIEFMPLPISLGLTLGDIAFNFRASLDHLAWALVNQGTCPTTTLSDSERTRIHFPICYSPADLRSDEHLRVDRYGRSPVIKGGPRKGLPNLGCLPGVGRADLAIIRRYQPYVVGKKLMDFHGFSILTPLNNFDKHRELQPIHGFPIKGEIIMGNATDCVPPSELRGRMKPVPVQVGAELHFIPAKKTGPKPDLQVKVELTAEVCLDNGVPIIEWAATTGGWINKLLSEFSEPNRSAIEALPGFLEAVKP